MTETPIQETKNVSDSAINLMRELGFTQDDLTANRAGQLSEIQDYKLRYRRRTSIFTGIIILLFLVIIASALIFFGTQEDGSIILTLIGIGFTIGSAAIMGVFARFWFRLSADIQHHQVSAYEGELQRVVKPLTRRVMNYVIRVDQAEVFVSKEAFEVFEHKKPYAIYRTPYTGILLSAERLEE